MKSIVVASLLLFGWSAFGHSVPNEDRRAFVEAFHRLKYRMTKEQVSAILGPPELVRKEYVHAYQVDGTSERWWYGIKPGDNYPTLGAVAFDVNGLLEGPQNRDLPSADLPGEEATRDAIRLIARVGPAHIGYSRMSRTETFDPIMQIRAANAIIRLGEKKGLAVLEEFFNTEPMESTSNEALLCLVRLLFEPPQDTGVLPLP